MINAIFTAKPKKGTLTMRVSGHAMSAEKGKDLVCASASILALTLAQAVAFADAEGKLECRPDIQLIEGKASITATPKDEFRGEILHTFYVIQVGFDLLSVNFRKYVNLKMFGESLKGFDQ